MNIPSNLELVPPVRCDFHIADRVTFANDQGAVFPGHIVLGFSPSIEGGRFIYLDLDCWWFPVRPDNLTKEAV